MSHTYTPQQQAAIEGKGKIIVSAGAGSGKTFVMIERLVKLILSGTDVRSILAVTFTNKAAAQMRDRLRSALLEQAKRASGEEKERLKQQLNELALAEISTIHAFCGRLIRSRFFLTDRDAAFRIVSADDPTCISLSKRALDRVFERAYEEEGDFYRLLSVYFRKKKDDLLRSVVKEIHGKVRGMADYRSVLLRVGEDNFQSACSCLLESYRSFALYVMERMQEDIEWFSANAPRAVPTCESVIEACRPLAEAETLFSVAGKAYEGKIGRVPPKTKATGEELRRLEFLSSASKAVKEVWKEVAEYRTEEEERAYFDDAAARAGLLARLVLAYDDEFTLLKREENVLDYNDLEHLALQILENEDVRRELRERYTYLFVDEYQDVNLMQERILSLLAGEEVFLVGDSKQAIYGFRGSNSAFFERKREEYGREGDLSLTGNFRSADAILGVVNKCFAPLVKEYEPMQGGGGYGEHRGEVLFHLAGEETKSEEEPRGIYSVLGAARREDIDPTADRITALVEEELGKTFFDAELGKERQVSMGDIAILVRKNSGMMEHVVRRLDRANIPASSSSKVDLCSFFEARLIIDWLSYLDDAEQDIPMASAMLSAIGGFTDADLAEIRYRFSGEQTFRAACERYRTLMSDALSEKLRAFGELSERLRTESYLLPAAEMLAKLFALGLEAQIAACPRGTLRLARARKLIEESASCANIHEFLARLRASGFRMDYAGSGGEGSVQVLTMHASKGLEFPIVILADLDVLFHGPDRGEILWDDGLLAAPKSYDAEEGISHETVLRRAIAEVQTAEERKGEKNLLYVAMTRAKYRLHLMFGTRESGLGPAYAKRLSDFIDPALFGELFVIDRDRTPEAVPRRAMAGEEQGLTEKILSVYRRPYPYSESVLLPVKSSATELMKENESMVFGHGGTESGHTAEEGIAYHAFLQNVDFGMPADTECRRMAAEGLLSEDQLSLLDMGRLNAILQIPCLKSLAGKTYRREQTFLISLPACEIMDTDAQDEIVFQGAIDLLLEEEGRYTVFDYKFSVLDDDSIRRKYALQMKLYCKAVAKIKRVKETDVAVRFINLSSCREIRM